MAEIPHEENFKKTDEFWETFDKLTDKQKVNYLLEFESIFDTVNLWDSATLEYEHNILKEKEE